MTWTQAIKSELCRIGRGEEFKCKVGAHAREVAECHRDYGEWLYDVTWLEYDRDGCVTAAHLVAECEWGDITDIDEDFQKLLLARATVRLMIFDGNYNVPFRARPWMMSGGSWMRCSSRWRVPVPT